MSSSSRRIHSLLWVVVLSTTLAAAAPDTPDFICGTVDSELDEVTLRETTATCAIPGDGSVIDLLIVYTAAGRAGAETRFGTDIGTILDEHMAYTNDNITDSLVAFQWNLVAHRQTDYIESGSQGTDKARLDNPNDGFMDDVQAQADQLGVDVIGLIVEACTPICGIGGAGSFIWAGNISNEGLFAHESGHVLGGAHCRSYQYVQWRTIMGLAQSPTCVGGNPPENFGEGGGITHYSNPDVIDRGHLTGDATHNNAATMNSRRLAISAIRDAPDCNCNGVADSIDIQNGTSVDADGDGQPDECQCSTDADCSDALFCNGAETCDAVFGCQAGTPPCQSGETCDESVDVCFVPVCGNLTCEVSENCVTCPGDCPTLPLAWCGDGACQAGNGENCDTCPGDCATIKGGGPPRCCGEGGSCSQDPGCADPNEGNACTPLPLGNSCCGDGVCEGQETNANCAVDCP